MCLQHIMCMMHHGIYQAVGDVRLTVHNDRLHCRSVCIAKCVGGCHSLVVVLGDPACVAQSSEDKQALKGPSVCRWPSCNLRHCLPRGKKGSWMDMRCKADDGKGLTLQTMRPCQLLSHPGSCSGTQDWLCRPMSLAGSHRCSALGLGWRRHTTKQTCHFSRTKDTFPGNHSSRGSQ
jgi:hypothetical protein